MAGQRSGHHPAGRDIFIFCAGARKGEKMLTNLWLADKCFYAHSALTILAAAWALLIGQPALLAAFVGMWALALVVWLEWRKAG
jgi:hypothetical protein